METAVGILASGTKCFTQPLMALDSEEIKASSFHEY